VFYYVMLILELLQDGSFFMKGKEMNFYQEYKSPFGYQTGTNGIDSYGVDHRGFDTRDELEYQTASEKKSITNNI